MLYIIFFETAPPVISLAFSNPGLHIELEAPFHHHFENRSL
jgi:hypothetical protein